MRSFRTALALVSATLLLAAPAMAQSASPATPPSRVAPATPGMAGPAATTPAASSAATPAKTPDAALVDINSATREQLDALPQIGPARADAIVKGRPYRAKTELRKILPANAYDAIDARIVARQK